MLWRCHIFALRFIAVLLSGLGLTASPLVPSALAADLEHYVHRLVNEHRTSQGLKPLAFNPEIAAIARSHSQNMATGRVGYGHGGFGGRTEKIARLLTQWGVGENVLRTITNEKSPSYVGTKAVAGWLGSPGHRRNIEGAYDLTGIGVAQGPGGEYFLTQLFVRTTVYRPGTSGSDTPHAHSAPAVRDQKNKSQAIEIRPLSEKDPRQRPGRKRTADGWVQTLD